MVAATVCGCWLVLALSTFVVVQPASAHND